MNARHFAAAIRTLISDTVKHASTFEAKDGREFVRICLLGFTDIKSTQAESA